MDRIIFHSDINHCFAQIEEMLQPEYKEVPMCTGGDESQRQGIVSARNLIAKAYGVQSGESVREAKRKCPQLVVLPTRHDIYHYYTEKVKDIYREYTDQVESFGMDEAWMDVTHSYHLFVDKPYDLAAMIQKRVLDEVGLTVSIGVSWNKAFAKLGSDLIKPSGLVIISRGNVHDIVDPLPVSNLLMVGKASLPKLKALGIETIKDLREADPNSIMRQLGKLGSHILESSRGEDTSPVLTDQDIEPIKSMSHGLTPPFDIATPMQAHTLITRLSETISARLKQEGLQGNCVAITYRDRNLKTWTRQKKLHYHTHLTTDITDQAIHLLTLNYDFDQALRSITVAVSGLIPNEHIIHQHNLFSVDTHKKETEASIDATIETLRKRFGHGSIKRANALLDQATENFEPNSKGSLLPGNFMKKK